MKAILFSLLVVFNTPLLGQSPYFILDKASGAKGELVEIDLFAGDFNNGASFFLSVEWDSDIIIFDKVVFSSDDIGLNNGDFNLIEDNRLHISWESEDVTNGTTFSRLKIATIRYLVVGDIGEKSTIAFTDNVSTGQRLEYYEINNGLFELKEVEYQTGGLTVVGSSSESSLPRFFVKEEFKNADEIYLDVIGTNFDGASSFLISLVWDSDVMSFSRFGEGVLLNSNISVGNIEENRMVLTWEADDFENGLSGEFLLLKKLVFDIVQSDSCLSTKVEFQDISSRGQLQEYWRVSSGSFQLIQAEHISATINLGQSFDLGQDVSLCNGKSITLDIPENTDSIKWFLNNVLYQTDQPSITISAEGLITVEFEENGCSQSGELFVDFIENEIIGLSNDLQVTEAIPFEAPEISEGISYKWRGDSMIQFSCLDCRTPIITANETGFIAVDITDSSGCTFSSSIIVEVINVDPIDNLIVFTPFNNPSCNNVSDGIIDLLIRGGLPPYEVNWSDGNTEISRNDLLSGKYGVVITDQRGVSVETEISLEAQALPKVVSEITDKTCSSNGGSIELRLEDDESTFTVEWIPDTLEGAFVENLPPGTYVYNITDSFGCTVSDSLEVVNVESGIDLIPDVVLCPDSSLSLQVPVEFTDYEILWAQDDISISTDERLEIFEAGTYVLSLVKENCFLADTIIVSRTDFLSLPIDTVVMNGDMLEFSIEGEIESIVWVFPVSYNASCINCVNPIVTPDVSDSVTVQIEFTSGCVQTTSFSIEVVDGASPSPIKPINYLSPNGDGINDILAFEDLMQFQERRLVVMNEWGKELIDIPNYQNDWDATFKGEKLPDGVYYYFLSYKNQEEDFITPGDLLILNN